MRAAIRRRRRPVKPGTSRISCPTGISPPKPLDKIPQTLHCGISCNPSTTRALAARPRPESLCLGPGTTGWPAGKMPSAGPVVRSVGGRPRFGFRRKCWKPALPRPSPTAARSGRRPPRDTVAPKVTIDLVTNPSSKDQTITGRVTDNFPISGDSLLMRVDNGRHHAHQAHAGRNVPVHDDLQDRRHRRRQPHVRLRRPGRGR